MENHIYKVGDLVKVKSKEFFLNHPKYNPKNNTVEFDSQFAPNMFKYCDKFARVVSTSYIRLAILTHSKSEDEALSDARNGWMWDNWMIEPANKFKLEII